MTDKKKSEEVESEWNLNINQMPLYRLYLEIHISDSDSWNINLITFFLGRLSFSYVILYSYKTILFGVPKAKYCIFTK